MSFTPINGPIRVVPVANIPCQFLAVDRLGIYLAQGTESALSAMAGAWNEQNAPTESLPVEKVKVTACPECGYPKESEEQAKCLSCLNPPQPTVENEVEQKEAAQSEWF